MCERHLGVGADGLMLVLPSAKADFRMRLFNADGSEAEVSGNGVRCLVKYAVERGIAAAKDDRVTIEAVHDILEAQVFREGGKVVRARLSMGQPRFEPKEIPLRADVKAPVLDYEIDVGGERVAVSCMSIGNPHAVHFIEGEVNEYPLESIGPQVEHHPAFPARVNYGVARVVSAGADGRARVGARGGRDAGLRERLLRGDGDGASEGLRRR